MKITLHRLFPVLGLALAAGLFIAGSAVMPEQADAGGKPCTTKKFATKAVKDACAKNGQKGAKKLMKKVVKMSKKAGDEKSCLDCHKDLKSWARTKNAVADLKKYIK
ncbi:MAG: hypothetical protein KJO07_12480 [Deltaproteobacteria bacterium]|jgi:hypothetical protein|nr:hypothetical protein [Deltaproteobacteria bacterium]